MVDEANRDRPTDLGILVQLRRLAGRFAPGASGNPAGRPPMVPASADKRGLTAIEGIRAEVLARQLGDSGRSAEDRAAARAELQAMRAGLGDVVTGERDISRMSDGELLDLLLAEADA